MSKIFELLVQNCVRDYIQRLDELIPVQFGFQACHPSTHQLTRLVEIIFVASCYAKQTFALFLDIEQAFDRV